MRRSLSLIPFIAAAIWPAPAAAQPSGPGFVGRGLFVSPAGEPFRRAPDGPQPLRAWFAQADTDGDGALTVPELQADFARWFGVLDADRNGEIGPDEIANYESVILPEMRSGGAGGFRPGMRMRGGGPTNGVGGGGRGGRGGGSARRGDMAGRLAMMSGAARFGLLPISHPLMDADTNFNRGISPDEFRQAAGRRFVMLDTQHVGRLTLEQLAASRRQDFDAARRDSPGLGTVEEARQRDD
ncbi:MAG TPA: EF-hand domain-containing protein [Allosphingosinicella sp.]|nr:EF-hand domain-containing protein [Allosphingosinicella sp.]